MERRRAGARLGAVWFSAGHFGVGGKVEGWTTEVFFLGWSFFLVESGVSFTYLIGEDRKRVMHGDAMFVCAITYMYYYTYLNSRLERYMGGKLTFSLFAIIIDFQKAKNCLCQAADLWGLIADGCTISCVNIVWKRQMNPYLRDEREMLGKNCWRKACLNVIHRSYYCLI